MHAEIFPHYILTAHEILSGIAIYLKVLTSYEHASVIAVMSEHPSIIKKSVIKKERANNKSPATFHCSYFYFILIRYTVYSKSQSQWVLFLAK